MGKTYRNVFGGSQSIDYHSPHSRTILGTKKANSRRQIRNNNKMCDEDNIKNTNCIKNKIKEHWASMYYGKIGNIPNMPSEILEDKLKIEHNVLHGYMNHKCIESAKWNRNGDRMEIMDNKIINEPCDRLYLIATKKQIQRRGDVGRFMGKNMFDICSKN